MVVVEHILRGTISHLTGLLRLGHQLHLIDVELQYLQSWDLNLLLLDVPRDHRGIRCLVLHQSCLKDRNCAAWSHVVV